MLKNIGIKCSLCLCILSSCVVFKGKYNYNLIKNSIEGSELFSSHFTGFALYDPIEGKYLYTVNEDKYFTPASNTKLFTFYAGLKILKDSVPGIKYVVRGDSLIFWGTGDPTFLNPDFENQPIFNFLDTTSKKLYYASGNFSDPAFGPGWAWDDFEFYFQPERSAFPMYGNVVSVNKEPGADEESVLPSFFGEYIDIDTSESSTKQSRRHQNHNIFRYQIKNQNSSFKARIPYQTSAELTRILLEDTLNRPVETVAFKPYKETNTLMSVPTSDLYQVMLKSSDNFLAEQILYLCASTKADTLNSSRVRNFITNYYLNDLSQKPIWKDGSGLSRYNLITPESFVELLVKIQKSLPAGEFLSYFPIGGVDGTLKNWYKSESEPYIFAKTGTLSNNHALSGFIKTKSNRLLIFSFMNNNYNNTSHPVKREMEKTLRIIYERY